MNLEVCDSVCTTLTMHHITVRTAVSVCFME